MAKNIEISFTGRIGNVVGVMLNGKYYLKKYQKIVKQTAATKVSSSNFGKASSAGKNLRNLLLPVTIPFDKGTSMPIKFSGCISKWLKSNDVLAIAPTGNIAELQGFNFNTTKDVVNSWQQLLTVEYPNNKTVQVNIPAFIPRAATKAPVKTSAIICTIMVACCRLTEDVALGSKEIVLTYPYNKQLVPAQTLLLDVAGDADTLIVTAVSVRYRLNKDPEDWVISDKDIYMPCGVVGATYR